MVIPRQSTTRLATCLLAGGLACAVLLHAGPACAEAGTAPPAASQLILDSVEATAPDAVPSTTETAWWREGVTVFATLWDDARARLADDVPDWLQHVSRQKPAASLPDANAAYVVLQDDRADGMDLVTLRYRLAGQGPLRAYAGAGLNHAKYFDDVSAAGPSLLTRRNSRRDVGPTAELGAEFAFTERVRLNADLRWADLDDSADDMLNTAYGPVLTDPVTLGISLGYRFR